MGQKCSICCHPDRLEIDRQIVSGKPHLRIGKTFGLTDTSVANHARNHLSRQLLKSTEIMEKANASKLLGEIDICLVKAKGILSRAETDKKYHLQLSALREIRQSVEFLAKLAVSLADLQQKRELADRVSSGQSVVILPEKQMIIHRLPDSEQSRRDKRRAERREARRLRMQQDDQPEMEIDQSAAEIERILAWEPEGEPGKNHNQSDRRTIEKALY